MGRVLALDIGSKRIGVAVSDELRLTAQGLETIPARPPEEALERLQQLVKDYNIDIIVVGHPIRLDGSSGSAAEAAGNFARLAGEALPVKVCLVDERLSSAMAEKAMLEGNLSRKRRRSLRDRLSAVLILQSYLDGSGREG